MYSFGIVILCVINARVESFIAPLRHGQRSVAGFRVAPLVKLDQSSGVAETSTGLQISNTKRVTGKSIGLLTFDLDDTLYPIAGVVDAANTAFVRTMEKFGYSGLTPSDIVETGKLIREEIAAEDPQAAAVLTHTEVRELAIRREMENIMLDKKLKETADDWATPVSNLADVVVAHAKKWSRTAVSPSIVNAVLTAWEMERHHAAERLLYPEVLDVLKRIKAEHPDVVIGAVTDGRANPMFMTFTLAPFFDFCMSWEDDQGGRRKFFQELSCVEGDAQLSWIYDAAYDKYKNLRSQMDAINAISPQPTEDGDDDDDRVWIHVGDDLAYDVGGSSKSGAKTILVELADKYEQTARHRFDGAVPQPSWSTNLSKELEKRQVMNKRAEEMVDKKIAFLTQLPEAIDEILAEA
mmetsp:Transcript_8179/g.12557  ORF Transcript_8179/g.12557 Transcript_8179/m.12557 type:complete len:409 (-) Transcript_8179:117-1343(-)